MAWRLEFSDHALADFEIIFDHLHESYTSFGEPPPEAFEHAQTRVLQLRADADRILVAPHRGQQHNEIFAGSRNLTIGQASYWFVVDDHSKVVTVLAVFFGGQEQRQRMLLRMLNEN